MKAIRQARPMSVYVLMGLLTVLGVSALAGGFGLFADPTGESVGIPLEWLEHSPFSSFLIPGLVLFCLLGVFPLLTVFALWTRPGWGLMRPLERRTHEHWSWSAGLTAGIAALVWIAVQFLMLGVRHPVQIGLEVFIAALGLALVASSLLPSVRRYYAR